jgi:acyl-CoA thioester hydrolase
VPDLPELDAKRVDESMREYWRGSAEAWECDEMGHMNVRYWVGRCLDGVQVLAEDIGVSGAFREGATATLLPSRQHIKFMREARAGAPLFLRGGIVSLGETELIFYAEMVHSFTGEIGATFITTLAHVDAKTGKAFPFPARVGVRSKAFAVTIPVHGKPRTIVLEGDLPNGTCEIAEAAGFTRVGLSGVRASDVDGFDRLNPEGFIGRVSNGMPNLLSRWREDATAEMSEIDGLPRIAGAAVLEYRLDYLAWPGRGDQVAVYSGLKEVADKTITLAHWVMDPVSGAPWCVCEALAVTLDLSARKIIANPPRAKAALEAMRLKPLPSVPPLS